MWQSIFCAFLFLSASCLASSNFAMLPNQINFEELFNDHELENLPENSLVVNVDQLEDLIEELNHSKSSGKHVKIWFVNNTNPFPGNGSFKNPFNTLLAAQYASKKGDIIFVFPGDNTTQGMDQGFIMKDGQRLLGAGVSHKINFPQKKLVVRAPSTTLPHITNTNGNVVILANSCEVSGMYIVDIMNGDGILGGDPNISGPEELGIKNTVIRKNVIGTFRRDQSIVLNGAIYLPNCRGKLIVHRNYILNVLSATDILVNGTGIRLFNANRSLSSHVTIKKNVVSNTGATGIILSHNSPKGEVKAFIEGNIVFNIGQVGDAMFVGTERIDAGGQLCAEIRKNFCQNVHEGFDLHIQSTGKAEVKVRVKENVVARSATLESGGFLTGVAAASFDSSHLCLKLGKNFSEMGYALSQFDESRFRLEPPRKNLGLPFAINGNIKIVHAHKCSCESASKSESKSESSKHH